MLYSPSSPFRIGAIFDAYTRRAPLSRSFKDEAAAFDRGPSRKAVSVSCNLDHFPADKSGQFIRPTAFRKGGGGSHGSGGSSRGSPPSVPHGRARALVPSSVLIPKTSVVSRLLRTTTSTRSSG